MLPFQEEKHVLCYPGLVMEFEGLLNPCLGEAENETLVKKGKEGCGRS